MRTSPPAPAPPARVRLLLNRRQLIRHQLRLHGAVHLLKNWLSLLFLRLKKQKTEQLIFNSVPVGQQGDFSSDGFFKFSPHFATDIPFHTFRRRLATPHLLSVFPQVPRLSLLQLLRLCLRLVPTLLPARVAEPVRRIYSS